MQKLWSYFFPQQEAKDNEPAKENIVCKHQHRNERMKRNPNEKSSSEEVVRILIKKKKKKLSYFFPKSQYS